MRHAGGGPSRRSHPALKYSCSRPWKYRFVNMLSMSTHTEHEYSDTHEMALTELRAHLPDLVNRAAYAGESTYITRHGKRAAALVPAWLLEELEEAEDRADAEAVEQARTENDWVAWEDVKRELAR